MVPLTQFIVLLHLLCTSLILILYRREQFPPKKELCNVVDEGKVRSSSWKSDFFCL